MRTYGALLEICTNLGIDEIGITNTRPFFDIYGRLLEFNLPGFTQGDIKLRTDPLLTMKDAKTIICALFPYIKNEDIVISEKGTTGKIVSGDVNFGCDYHLYVKDRLNTIALNLKERFDGRYTCFCDTGPLVDKEIAFRCGLSKYGKNSVAINNRYGSYFFIGYIMTDLIICHKADVPVARLHDLCFNCEICIRACPTEALYEGGLIYERCISYISQKKGDLTDKEAAALNTLYGCHVCQNVCPANSKEKFVRRVIIDESCNLSNREFKIKYGDTAAAWIGKKTFIRNLRCLSLKQM